MGDFKSKPSGSKYGPELQRRSARTSLLLAKIADAASSCRTPYRLLPCRISPCRAGVARRSVSSVPPWRISFFGNQAVLRGFLAVENRAAGTAHGHAGLDLFRAHRPIRARLRVIEPRFLETKLTRRAPLQIRH